MSNSSEFRIITISGLLIKCPLGERLDDCPFNKYRHLSIQEKCDLAMNMSEEDAEKIIYQHRECILLREKDLLR